MARPTSPVLTDAELRLMKVLWERGKGTVSEIVDALPRRSRLAYSSVLTTLRILETKGYLRHEKQGRAFIYVPRVGRGEARRQSVQHLVDRFFDRSPGSLALNILENEDLDEEDLRKLRGLIEKAGQTDE
jgi:predicted transcriptional regulator